MNIFQYRNFDTINFTKLPCPEIFSWLHHQDQAEGGWKTTPSVESRFLYTRPGPGTNGSELPNEILASCNYCYLLPIITGNFQGLHFLWWANTLATDLVCNSPRAVSNTWHTEALHFDTLTRKIPSISSLDSFQPIQQTKQHNFINSQRLSSLHDVVQHGKKSADRTCPISVAHIAT